MVTAAEIIALANTLPRTEQALVRDQIKFRVRSIVYAAISADETTMGFGFPKEERDALTAAEPDKFFLPIASDLRFNWVCGCLAAIDSEEMHELILDAWQMVVPQKVTRAYFEDQP